MTIQAHRSAILHFLDHPEKVGIENAVQYFEDGLIFVEDGLVSKLGSFEALKSYLTEEVEFINHENALLMPGFIDVHIHYPQTEIVASYGEQLLEWLNNYTFPVEGKFKDKEYAKGIAKIFIRELLRAGTTTALVLGTVHKESVDAFFEVAQSKNLRMIAGKVMMDRHAPDFLLDTPDTSYTDSKSLIDRWHNNGRLRYAVTPRFSPTSTREQLERAGQLLSEDPSLYLHTHLSENPNEIAWVKELFPECSTYLDTYDNAGLLSRRSVFAHCIHLEDEEWKRMAQTQSGIAFCPTSNLFLGSGLFNIKRAIQENINVGIATDIGGGTSFSILETLNEAYKVIQLRGETLSPFTSFYLATLGGAETLDLADTIGNFEIGKEADFIILDKAGTPLMDFRMQQTTNLFEELFVFSMLGDDRTIRQTWSMGQLVHER